MQAAAVRVKRDEQLKSKADLELAQRVANQELFEYQELQRRLVRPLVQPIWHFELARKMYDNNGFASILCKI